jgi:hypothetical protein
MGRRSPEFVKRAKVPPGGLHQQYRSGARFDRLPFLTCLKKPFYRGWRGWKGRARPPGAPRICRSSRIRPSRKTSFFAQAPKDRTSDKPGSATPATTKTRDAGVERGVQSRRAQIATNLMADATARPMCSIKSQPILPIWRRGSVGTGSPR